MNWVLSCLLGIAKDWGTLSPSGSSGAAVTLAFTSWPLADPIVFPTGLNSPYLSMTCGELSWVPSGVKVAGSLPGASTGFPNVLCAILG